MINAVGDPQYAARGIVFLMIVRYDAADEVQLSHEAGVHDDDRFKCRGSGRVELR